MKRKQIQEELENIEASRNSLEESYHPRFKVLDNRENEPQEEFKAIALLQQKKINRLYC